MIFENSRMKLDRIFHDFKIPYTARKYHLFKLL